LLGGDEGLAHGRVHDSGEFALELLALPVEPETLIEAVGGRTGVEPQFTRTLLGGQRLEIKEQSSPEAESVRMWRDCDLAHLP